MKACARSRAAGILAVIAGCLVCAPMSGCAAWPRAWGTRACSIESKPVIRRQPIAWHLFDVTVLEPIKQPFHVVRFGRKLAGVPVRSLNLRDLRVTSSSVVTDRDPASLSADQVRWGPTMPNDLGQPPFVITKPKLEGKTPGFFVKDARGVRYLFKLDPVDAPELLTGAEVVASKLLYALGYHVPSYEVTLVAPGDLRLPHPEESTVANGRHGITDQALQALIGARVREGRVRVVASRLLDGEILGPIPFKRFKDCAEIRALKLASAWLNNTDTKDHNSLLVWNGTETVGYLIDFGTALGADAGLAGPKTPCEGWTNEVDLKERSLTLMTLGLHQPPCDTDSRVISPGLGRVSPRVDPVRWKPYAPNWAFAAMTDEDALWMSRRLAQFSRAQLEAAVSAGQYSNPVDAAYLVDVLELRRQHILERYLDGGS